MNNLLKILRVLFILFLIQSCKKDKPIPPDITTSDVTAISYTTAISGGNLTNEGSSAVLSMGICWDTLTSPTIENSKTIQNTALGEFVSTITQLSQNTIYYVRAFATNNAGTSYGNEVAFTTIQIAGPTLTTAEITSVTQTSAVTGGNITDENGGSVTQRGVCWSITTNPTINDDKTSDGIGTGVFMSTLTGLIGNTLYYVRAYATNSAGTQYGEQVSFKTSPLSPSLSTSETTSITQTSASCGGNVTDDGGSAVIARGVCWSTSQNPTISDNKTSDGTGIGNFSSLITGLVTNTVYYVRAYATNGGGTTYGNEITLILWINSPWIQVNDIDGNTYHTVKIGDQTWMVENLKTTRYNDGTAILNITDTFAWEEIGSGAYCDFENAPAKSITYGRLYNWYVGDNNAATKVASNGGKNVCPTGWHVPNYAEWLIFIKFAQSYPFVNPIVCNLNVAGFAPLPGNARDQYGEFHNINSGYWWSTTEAMPYDAQFILINLTGGCNLFSNSEDKGAGFSIRCLKDN